MSKIIKIDFQGLKEFLLDLNESDFQAGIKIKKGTSMQDIDYFNLPTSSLDYDEVIDYGDFFLVDAIGNDLSVCRLTRRNYKLPTGRLVPMKLIKTILPDVRSLIGSPLNGYWVIPRQYKLNK